MVEQAKALLNILLKRGFEAHFIGGKCRNDLHNQYHETKVPVKDIDIVTNATVEDLKKIFPNCSIRGESFQVVAVIFGGEEFEVATYRKDLYNSVGKGKIEKPETIVAQTLNEDRERRDFTINSIAQDINGNYVDYHYNYRNKKISAMNDIKNKVIRAIGNPKQRFEEDPLRILRAFRFMSQLGYEIEKNTISIIANNLKLLELIPHERIGMEMNKLITGNFAYATLTLMREIGVFNLQIKNSIDGNQQFLPNFKDIEDEHLQKLTLLNLNSKLTSLEVWTFIFQPLGSEIAKKNLESFRPINNDEIEKVEWLIDNYDLVDSEDIKIDLYNARTGIIKRHKLPCMRELLISLCHIQSKLNKVKYENIEKKLIDTFCSRPYFEEQLTVNGDQLIEMTGKQPGPWITQVKEKIILNIINEPKYPKNERIDEIIKNSIEEILGIGEKL
jgi:tRNA nucleotidyltransferase (CCA-adding enzyme)